MLDAFVVPPNTIISSKGDSDVVDITTAAHRVFLLTLSITSTVEHESIDVTLLSSADGAAWDPKPVASLPQKFYAGEYPLLVDLSASTDARFVRAHWEVTRWGRGPTTPRFEVALRLREVSKEAWQEAQAEAQMLR